MVDGYGAPDRAERLVICNLPHLKGLQRELAQPPQQRGNSQYTCDFQQPDAHLDLTAEELVDGSLTLVINNSTSLLFNVLTSRPC